MNKEADVEGIRLKLEGSLTPASDGPQETKTNVRWCGLEPPSFTYPHYSNSALI